MIWEADCSDCSCCVLALGKTSVTQTVFRETFPRPLWGTNWVLKSQKTTFFIVTAVKTSNLAFYFPYQFLFKVLHIRLSISDGTEAHVPSGLRTTPLHELINGPPVTSTHGNNMPVSGFNHIHCSFCWERSRNTDYTLEAWNAVMSGESGRYMRLFGKRKSSAYARLVAGAPQNSSSLPRAMWNKTCCFLLFHFKMLAPSCRPRGFRVAVGLERGPLSPCEDKWIATWKKTSGSGQENGD
jgi:hypothetical protein